MFVLITPKRKQVPRRSGDHSVENSLPYSGTRPCLQPVETVPGTSFVKTEKSGIEETTLMSCDGNVVVSPVPTTRLHQKVPLK